MHSDFLHFQTKHAAQVMILNGCMVDNNTTRYSLARIMYKAVHRKGQKQKLDMHGMRRCQIHDICYGNLNNDLKNKSKSIGCFWKESCNFLVNFDGISRNTEKRNIRIDNLIGNTRSHGTQFGIDRSYKVQ